MPKMFRELPIARIAHRTFFSLVSALPARLAPGVMARLFNRRFSHGSPWPYKSCPYEAAKRAALLSEISPDARIILEVGAADGHNLLAVASHAKESAIIGIDISQKACEIAQVNTRNHAHVRVENTDLSTLMDTHPWLRGSVDTVIVSEVLYYLGGYKSTSAQLKLLGNLLAEDGQIILIHGSEDAERLHMRLAEILNLRPLREYRKNALGRNFLVTSLGRSRARRAEPVPAAAQG